jgi:hypothetical protein
MTGESDEMRLAPAMTERKIKDFLRHVFDEVDGNLVVSQP